MGLPHSYFFNFAFGTLLWRLLSPPNLKMSEDGTQNEGMLSYQLNARTQTSELRMDTITGEGRTASTRVNVPGSTTTVTQKR